MSVPEEQSSMTLNDYSRPSSIAQRLYLNSTHLLSNPPLTNADSCSASGPKSSSADDASNLVPTSSDLTTYDAEVEKKIVTSGDSVPYFGRPQTQTISTPVHSMPYYPGHDYPKYPIVPPPSSTNLNCLQTFPVGQHADYTDRGQTALQTASASTRLMDPSYFPAYPASAVDGSRFTCAPGGVDGHSRYADPLVNRQARHTFPMYHLPSSDDQVNQPASTSRVGASGVELLVSNLDYNIGAKEWRKILFTQLQSIVKNVHSIVIQTQADGSNYAIIKVGSIEDARLAISHFHRKKIGYKRIQVNIVSQNGTFGTRGLKNEVVSLLRSVSSNALPVCKFIDLFEKRYHRSISVSDLYKMRDVIEIKEQPGSQGGRLITLSVRAQRYDGTEAAPSTDPVLCRRHCVEGSQDYLQAMDCAMLPNVQVSLNVFRQHVLKLLQDHGGSMPLLSFPACYKAEFGLDQMQSLHALNGFSGSNPLASTLDLLGNTKSQLADPLNSTSPTVSQSSANLSSVCPNGASSPGVLLDQLHQFSREVVDLLKHQPGCQILLSKFIPSYHHHFGKQCRVADYGYSKLHELIDALPTVVHVMGSGHVRLLTLSHRVQVRRFTNELIKVLKSQSTKSCRLADYAAIYRRIYRKDFRITDYGVCYLPDMLMEVSDSAVEVSQTNGETTISLPKRVQTMEERERTELFAIEVADLLCQSPRCRLPFNKFIPSYHHHFSRQCRVADYGFTKLIDLLEAVPNVVQIVEEHGEKFVALVRQRHLRIVAEQLLSMLEAAPGKRIPLNELPNVYVKHQGYALCLEDFEFNSVRELLSKLPRLVRIETICLDQSGLQASLTSSDGDSTNVVLTSTDSLPSDKKSATSQDVNDDESTADASHDEGSTTPTAHTNVVSRDPEAKAETKESSETKPGNCTVDYVCLADRAQIKHLAHKVLLVLLEAQSGTLSITQFSERFRCTFRDEPNLNLIHDELGDIVEFKKLTNRSADDALLATANSTRWNDRAVNESAVLGTSSSTTVAEQDSNIGANEILLTTSFSDAVDSSEPVTNWEATTSTISLRPLIMFARELRELLRQNQGKLLLVQLCAVYQRRFGIPLRPQRYNYPSLATLLQAVDFVAMMRGRGVRCMLVLCQDFLGKLSYRVAYNTKPVLEKACLSQTTNDTDSKELCGSTRTTEVPGTKSFDSEHINYTCSSWNLPPSLQDIPR
ncbi:Limkain-b1 [Fasciola gigantica]|uniref:Limkain-b1 n=1 Tax=Fasciola gigantica TaxID=46835 RepID=A0A504YH88_FASGI|nr:Limkain-b1 [Fasciola gigantica]